MPKHLCCKIAGAIVLPNIGGMVNSRITRRNLHPWYSSLQKPWFSPPNQIFAPVWITLYSGMGYASYLVWRDGGGFGGDAKYALGLYGTQLALNWAWSPIFFHKKNFTWSLVDITALTGVAAACGIAFYKINEKAGLIFIPYVAWLAFASVLNYSILKLNNNASNPEIEEIEEIEKNKEK